MADAAEAGTETGEEFIKIIVGDNGIGSEQTYAEKIFESFSRLNPKDKHEGTGLGLALCKKIVLRHNGLIKAEGKLNAGATFKIFLPKSYLILWK